MGADNLHALCVDQRHGQLEVYLQAISIQQHRVCIQVGLYVSNTKLNTDFVLGLAKIY